MASTEDQEKTSNISKRVNKVLESRIESDKDALMALKELNSYFHENTIQSRRNLRSNIEKRSLSINENFLSAFRKVKERLDAIYEDVIEMNFAVQSMSQQLVATKAQTNQLIEQTTKLQAENEKLTLEEKIASAMINTFQLTESEVTSLREGDINEEFFRVLERAATIHNDCRSLMQSGHQVIAIEIMEQMAVLYRWAQTNCKSIESPTISNLLTKAMAKMQDRPVLFKYVISAYCTHRRSVLVRIFVDALTKGGPGGTPRPIEMSAHDPQRYISDMLAFLHQTVPCERENLAVLLSACQTIDVGEEIQEALATISEGVVTPLKVRIEQIIFSPEIQLKTLYIITNLLSFYRETFAQEVGEKSGLTRGLADCETNSCDTLLEKLGVIVRKEIMERVSLPPKDLSPSPGVDYLLSLLRDLLSVARVSNYHHEFLNKLVSSVLDPLLEGVNVSASRLTTTDMAVYLLNCLHLMQTTVTLYEFIDDRLERLQAQCDAQIDTLTSEQASSLVANLNLGPIYMILEEQGSTGPLTHIPGMQPSSLANFISKFDSFVSMPELLLLPQVHCLLSGVHRWTVQRRATEVILAIYKKVYSSVHDPANLYDSPQTLVPRTPQEVADLLLHN
uniref:Conserved oligomeric Golgi complex subunit 6 n=1 Tax=Rhodnius prolixus TaxID=13249 RepID=T1I707_RHOPR